VLALTSVAARSGRARAETDFRRAAPAAADRHAARPSLRRGGVDSAWIYMWIDVGPFNINPVQLSLTVGGAVLLWGLWKLRQRKT